MSRKYRVTYRFIFTRRAQRVFIAYRSVYWVYNYCGEAIAIYPSVQCSTKYTVRLSFEIRWFRWPEVNGIVTDPWYRKCSFVTQERAYFYTSNFFLIVLFQFALMKVPMQSARCTALVHSTFLSFYLLSHSLRNYRRY